MSESSKRMQIALCMGSSCYPRGNAENLLLIRHYIETHDLSASVELVGHRCQGHCKQGPNLMVDEELHCEIAPSVLPALLRQFLPVFKTGDAAAPAGSGPDDRKEP